MRVHLMGYKIMKCLEVIRFYDRGINLEILGLMIKNQLNYKYWTKLLLSVLLLYQVFNRVEPDFQ